MTNPELGLANSVLYGGRKTGLSIMVCSLVHSHKNVGKADGVISCCMFSLLFLGETQARELQDLSSNPAPVAPLMAQKLKSIGPIAL